MASIIRIEPQKMFQTILLSFLAVQIIFWILSQFFPEIPLVKGGVVIFLFLIVVVITTIYTLGLRITELSLKRDGIFILIVFGAVIFLFIYLPELVPELFSINAMDTRDFLRDIVGNIVRLGPTGIAG